ncbi:MULTISPECIES: hypothetical protein [Cupriavidus]|uniref:hypothetical protein n=1 Tax=Cupriavidus TaxID=106589 RepID=UPI00036B4270|nr:MULTISPECIES: hypothetical protein [Cupriavidus]
MKKSKSAGPGNHGDPLRATRGSISDLRMVVTLRPDQEMTIDSLADALRHNGEWLARASICLAALREAGAVPVRAVISDVRKGAVALDFYVNDDIAHCARLTRSVHAVLAREFNRVLPPSLLIAVRPLLDAAPERRRARSRPDELAASAVMLAESASEANRRMSAICAYLAAFHEARQVGEIACPEQQNLLADHHEAVDWRLRLHQSEQARSLAESLAFLQRTYNEAAFDLDTPFREYQALLQREVMLAFREDLASFSAGQRA